MRAAHLIKASLFFSCYLTFTGCMTPNEHSDLEMTEKGYYLSSTLWKSLDIPVCWENPQAVSESDRQEVQAVVNETWSSAAPFNFSGWGKCTAASRGIRIFSEDSGPHVKGLGNLLDGTVNGMVLNFDFKNWSPSCSSSEPQRLFCVRAIAVHEFGHAIGIAHEHNREDTPDTCTDSPQGTNGDITVGAWDADSVMNYCNTYTDELSSGDIETARTAYNGLINPSVQTKPAKPRSVKVSQTRSGKVKIEWRPGDQLQEAFQVQRSKQRNNGKWRNPQSVADLNGGVKRHKDNAGQGTFRYRVRALNAAGRSEWSNWKKLTVN